MELPNGNNFNSLEDALAENNRLKQELATLVEEINKMQLEAVQASQTLMQLVAENFKLKDQNQALIIENESLIQENEQTQKKLEKVNSISNRLFEIIEELQN